MYTQAYMCRNICIHIHIFYIYIERESDRETKRQIFNCICEIALRFSYSINSKIYSVRVK